MKNTKNQRYINLKEGDVLFNEGDSIDNNDLYLIQKGTAEIWKDKVHVNTLNTGSILGEMSLLVNAQNRT